MSLNKGLSADARTRILDAAGEIFVEHGFAGATIRKICSRVNLNIALVSYHFGDKEGLYLDVMKHFREQAMEEYPPDFALNGSSSREQRLSAFIRSLMFRLLSPGRASCFWKLFARELIEPTQAFDIMVNETVRPSYNLLMSMIRDLVGHGHDDQTCRLCAASIVGQCLFYRNSREVIKRIAGKDCFSPEEIEEIAGHITRFSLAAMRSYCSSNETGST